MLIDQSPRSSVAYIDADVAVTKTYGELADFVSLFREELRKLSSPCVVFLFSPNCLSAIACYLACLQEQIPLGLGEPSVEARKRVIETYLPTGVVLPSGESAPPSYTCVGALPGGELSLWRSAAKVYPVTPHAELALLLPTSGSTGDAKFVRLSRANLEANARSIASYLELGPGEVPILSLPLQYSYGLSIINSHLISGATIALTRHSFMRPEFWHGFDRACCTSFAAVPYMYETLHRLRMSPADRPTLRTLTQAGGHLNVELVKHFHALALKKEARMFVMYGQTEATARIAYVPPALLAEKVGTIGISIPSGELSLRPAEVEDAAGSHELCYRGANVMLGYASTPEDLARGDEMNGVLATGDIAECDTDGFFRITGRLARIAKVFGKRINLASVENELEKMLSQRVAVLEVKDGLRLFIEGTESTSNADVRLHLASLLGIPPLAIMVNAVNQIPLTASGKKNYKALV